MDDVNLNSPDPARRPAGEQGSARASSQSQPVENAPRTIAPEDEKQSEGRVEVTREGLDGAVARLNDFVQSVQRGLEFDVNDDTGRMVVRVIDQETEEVVRQIPDELALRMAQNLKQDEPLQLLNIRV